MIVYSEKYLEHDMENHPENARRLKAIMSYLEETGALDQLKILQPRYAEEEDILRTHAREHFDSIRERSKRGDLIGGETYVTSKTFDCAMLSAGGVLTAIDACLEGHKYAFALVRPPGHHATRDQAMGFCIFNNVAIGARYAMEKKGVERVFILDFDVHHGNGTEAIFYSSPVLYCSLHQWPLYPGTGSLEDVGTGEGEGYTINLPLPPGTCDSSYLKVFEELILPILRDFDPELVLVSSGYDAHYRDPLASLMLSSLAYSAIARGLKENARNIAFSLEGGYNLEVLARSVYATLSPLFGLEDKIEDVPQVEEEDTTARVERLMREAKKTFSEYWDMEERA